MFLMSNNVCGEGKFDMHCAWCTFGRLWFIKVDLNVYMKVTILPACLFFSSTELLV